jgi:hypothetical protein
MTVTEISIRSDSESQIDEDLLAEAQRHLGGVSETHPHAAPTARMRRSRSRRTL